MKSNKKTIFSFSIVFLLTLILFIFQNLLIGQNENNDTSLWHYIGWSWLHFNQPTIIGFADNKPFGIHLIYYFSSFFFGLNTLPLTVLSLILKFLTSFVVYLTTLKLEKNQHIAFISLIIFLLLSSEKNYDNHSSIYTESFVNFFGMLSFYLLLRNNNIFYIIISSLLLLIAYIFKQSIIFTIPGYLVFFYLFSKKEYIKNIFAFLIFFLIFLCLYIYCISFTGINFNFIIKQTFFPLNYESDTVMQFLPRINNFLLTWSEKFKSITIVFAFIIFCFFYINKLKSKNIILLSTFLICLFFSIQFTGITNGHQLSQIFPILSISFAVSLTKIFENFNYRIPKHIYLVPPILLFFPTINLSYIKQNINIYKKNNIYFNQASSSTYDESFKIKEYLDKNYNKNELIHTHFRDPTIILITERQSATKYINTVFLYSGYGNGTPIKKNIDLLLQDLNQNKPKVIITLNDYSREPPGKKPSVLIEILKNYTLKKKISNFLIYERK